MKSKLSSFILVIALSFSGYFSFAQNGALGAYEDIQQFFHVFDNGQFKQLEALKVQDYVVGRNLVAYVNNQGQFKVYQKGYARTLTENRPDFFQVSDHLVVFGLGGNMYVFEDKRSTPVGAFTKDFVLGDSMLAFNTFNNNFVVYYRGRAKTVEVFTVTGLSAGKNVVAYMDNLDQFQAYLYGEKYLLDMNIPKNYKTGRNTVAFVDFYGRFKIFYKGDIIEADAFAPKSYEVGDNMVAFVNRNGQFIVFDDGLLTTVESQPPSKYEVNDAIIAYSLPSRQFKAYYKGQTFNLESYIPESYMIDNEVLVYPDYMNYLKALDHGELVKASNRITYGYDLWIDVVSSDVGKGQPQFYYKGKFY